MNLPTNQRMSKTGHQKTKNYQTLFSFLLCLFIIFAAVKITLMFKPLYFFDLHYLNIENQSNYSQDIITENYDYVIKYLLVPGNQEFELPSIPYSKYGQIHFKDVKNIFTTIDIMLSITGILSFIGLIFNFKNKNSEFLKRTSSMLIVLPLILLSVITINFDKSFVIFHKIFFKNDFWLLDPDLDPIVTILPQEFFLHAALLIVFIIIFCSIVLRLLYKKFKIHSK